MSESSNIIKASEVRVSDRQPVVLSDGAVFDVGEELEPLSGILPVQTARRRADKDLRSAKRKAEEIEREAYQRGFEQGEKAGAKMAQAKIEPVQKAFSQLVEELASRRRVLMEENEAFVLQMGILAAAEILHEEVTLRPEAVLGNVRAALEKVVRGSQLVLRVSPHDYKLVQAHLPELLTRIADEEHFRLEADAEVIRGGCFLSSEGGDIDAQIDHQLAMLRERFLSEE